MKNFEFNERGLEILFAQIRASLDAADRDFRATHTGLPVDVVRADAPDALPDGIDLGEHGLDACAEAVSAGEPFEFRLEG